MSFWDFKPHIEIKHKPVVVKYCNPFPNIILDKNITFLSEEEQFYIIKNCIKIYMRKWDDDFRIKYTTGFVYKKYINESIDFGVDGEPINLINKFKERDFVL